MNNNFSAKEPALGYFYQLRYGLYLLLSSRQHEDVKILIESLDDIELQIANKMELLQTKYHLKSKTNLSDRSSDFWKTIRVWSEEIISGLIDIDNTIFSLVTTESISTKSFIMDIKNKTDIGKVLSELRKIAKETTNSKNLQGYQAFLGLSDINQKKLIEKIYIIDASLDFDEIDKKIKNELKLSALNKHIEPMLDRLEGWFFKQCIYHLQEKKDSISFNELQMQINYISDSFSQENLPIDFPDKIIPTDKDYTDVSIMRFYKQLDLIHISPRLRENAISNYYRAFGQRSKWLREELLNPQEEIDYDKKLVDDWEQKFDLLLDKTDGQSDEKKIEDGKKFYIKFHIDQTPQIFIRDRFREDYLTRGSYHMLANNLKVGWHPNYEILKKVDDDT